METEGRGRHVLEVAALFLKLGTISFGGPAAHVALMEQEVVTKRDWLARDHFLDLLAATNLVPGPNAVEMACQIGYVRAGWAGLVAGGVAFIIPAFMISLALAWVYVGFGALPPIAALFYGINPVVLAILLGATYRLGRTALRDKRAVALAVACLAAALLGANEILVLLAAGAIGMVVYSRLRWPRPTGLVLSWVPLTTIVPLLAALSEDRLARLFLFWLKTGAVLFGSGMVLFALIKDDVVTRYGWLTAQQFLDAIVVGQMTPGPVLSSATFIGYLVEGLPGALVATAGVFLPAFVIVALIGPRMERLRRSPVAQAFLRGVNAAVVALIMAVAVAIFRTAIVDAWTGAILVLSLAALLRFKVDALWLVLVGAAAGLVRFLIVAPA